MTNLVSITLAILLQVESCGNPNPPDGDGGLAVGVLQMHPCMVEDVNRILGVAFYTLGDRRDPDKSIEMGRIWLTWCAAHRHITLPHKLAARWNQPATGNVTHAYRQRIAICWCANIKARRAT